MPKISLSVRGMLLFVQTQSVLIQGQSCIFVFVTVLLRGLFSLLPLLLFRFQCPQKWELISIWCAAWCTIAFDFWYCYKYYWKAFCTESFQLIFTVLVLIRAWPRCLILCVPWLLPQINLADFLMHMRSSTFINLSYQNFVKRA